MTFACTIRFPAARGLAALPGFARTQTQVLRPTTPEEGGFAGFEKKGPRTGKFFACGEGREPPVWDEARQVAQGVPGDESIRCVVGGFRAKDGPGVRRARHGQPRPGGGRRRRVRPVPRGTRRLRGLFPPPRRHGTGRPHAPPRARARRQRRRHGRVLPRPQGGHVHAFRRAAARGALRGGVRPAPDRPGRGAIRQGPPSGLPGRTTARRTGRTTRA